MYKRQGYKRAVAAMELATRVCGDIDPTIYEQAALGIRTQAQAQAEAQGTTPVSYTHLDVYKRQSLMWKAILEKDPYPVTACICWSSNPLAWAPNTKRCLLYTSPARIVSKPCFDKSEFNIFR